MAEIVTGTPAVVGFTNGYGNHRRDHGWTGKDMQFASTIDRGEHTRDILQGQRFESAHLRDAIAATGVAVEKNGMANQLATEKIGAAAMIAAEKIGAASVQATHDQAHSLALQVCDLKSSVLLEMEKCCCEIKRDVAEVKATVLAVDAGRIRDALQQAQTELTMLRRGGSNGS